MKPKMGRPRGFDEDAALEAAMRVFWEKSYEGATISDLTEAMGINRPSLYAAFGDKEALYAKALDRYTNGPLALIGQALARPVLKDALQTLFADMVDFLSTPGNPRGCMSLQGALACGTESKRIQQLMIDWRKAGEAQLKKRFVKAQKAGELPASIQAATFARYVVGLLNALGVQSANGATKAEMKAMVDLALGMMLPLLQA